ncbi:hypothetical protein MNBD_GAMMA08-1776 [hydrothermal vent metagenome]|uniref:Methyl-accepting chemotaxis protein n=1 Tax=hydrothermal vent metagenome TaxID=652676 RepID=A0A3B0XG26_9ZZZZ
MGNIDQQPSFVISALLAGRLYRMLEITKVMSISSSNAKCISIRGGDKTAGFKPITDFISDMARDTISISSKINTVALQFSIKAVKEQRAYIALQKFKNVIDRLDGHSASKKLSAITHSLNDAIVEYRLDQYKDCKYLESLFDDISQRIRAARVIVTNSRTEASRAGEYQTNLFAIANDLQNCSDSISDEIKVCKTYLDDLCVMIRK